MFTWTLQGGQKSNQGPLTHAAPKSDFQDQLAQARGLRGDLQLPRRYRLYSANPAGPAAITVIYADASPTELPAAGDLPPDASYPVTSSEVLNAGFSPAAENQQGRAVPVAPLLRRNSQSGKLEIGNFKAVTLSGSAEDCVETGQSLLDDLNISGQHIETVADSGQITIARICASNGSVVLSCRKDLVTISPRRSRPDDKCDRLS